MGDPDEEVVGLITEIVTDYQHLDSKKLPIFAGFIDEMGLVHFSYVYCNYSDLHLISAAAHDEATLRMLAVNQDRLQKFINKADSEDDSE